MGSVEREFPVTFSDDQKKFIETFSDFTIAVEKRFVEGTDKGKCGWDNAMNFRDMFNAMKSKINRINSADTWTGEEVAEELIDVGVYVTFLWNLVRERK